MSEKSAAVIEAIADFIRESECNACFRQSHLNGTGAVRELEAKLCRFYGMKHALCVSNATMGLLGVALALDLRETEFVTTPYTVGWSLSSWLLLGNRPVFADIESSTLTLDPAAARRAITPATRALLAVDVFGNPCDMAALRRIADEKDLWFVLDAAQSFGAFRDGLAAGSLADALVVSFTFGKPLFSGEGGAVLTNNKELYERLVWYTQHPHRQHRDIGLHADNELSLNARIHPLSAVWANAIFDVTLTEIDTRRDRCFEIIEAIDGADLTQPLCLDRSRILPSFYRLAALWKSGPQEERLRQHLAIRGIGARITPSPIRLIYRQTAFVEQYGQLLRRAPHCPVAEAAAQSSFCIEECRILGRRRRSSPRHCAEGAGE